MTGVQKWFLLACLLRHPGAFARARDWLRPEHFQLWEDRLWRSLWSAALRIWRQSSATGGAPGEFLPSLDVLRTEVLTEWHWQGLGPEWVPRLDQFLAYCQTFQPQRQEFDWALQALQIFLQHQTADELVRQLSAPSRPQDLLGVLERQLRGLERLQYGLQGVTAREAIPWEDEYFQDYAPPQPTTLFMFNAFMGGGDRLGDLHGLLGPWGGGKTTCLIQHGVDRAAQYLSEWLLSEQRQPLGLVYYFAYEDPLYDLRLRMISCRGEISLSNLRRGRPQDVLLHEGYADYEHQRFGPLIEGGQFYPEFERYQLARNGLNWNFRLFGMGGQDQSAPTRGGGLVQEIYHLVREDSAAWAERIRHAVVPKLILIDFLGAALNRHFALKGKLHRAKEEYVFQAQLFMSDAKQTLANSLRTAVYVAHQYSGEANRKSRAIYPDHTDSAHFKSFSQHTDYTICFGAVQSGDARNLFVAKSDKHRKSATRPELICQLDGDFSRIREPEEKYVYDPITRQIVRQFEASHLSDLTTERSLPTLSTFLPGRSQNF